MESYVAEFVRKEVSSASLYEYELKGNQLVPTVLKIKRMLKNTNNDTRVLHQFRSFTGAGLAFVPVRLSSKYIYNQDVDSYKAVVELLKKETDLTKATIAQTKDEISKSILEEKTKIQNDIASIQSSLVQRRPAMVRLRKNNDYMYEIAQYRHLNFYGRIIFLMVVNT